MEKEISNDANRLLHFMYKEYTERRKQKLSKHEAIQFGSSIDIHEALMKDDSNDDVLEYLRELGNLGYIDNSYADDKVYDCSLTNKAIAELEDDVRSKAYKTDVATVKGVENLVYEVRGMQVMLDSDLADIYGYEVKNLNRQAKRNTERFPSDFMFQLEKNELEILRCQNGSANINPMSRTTPYVFTEQGIYMLATVLHSDFAVQQSIAVMRAFRNMKHYIAENRQLASKEDLKQLTLTVSSNKESTDKEIRQIGERLDELSDTFVSDKELKTIVIYKGQKFEADSAYIYIYKRAKKTIYIVDDYVNNKTLQLLSQKHRGVEVLIFTENGHGNKGFLTCAEIRDFNTEYPMLSIKPNNQCHDRFIVLDYDTDFEKVYHCGA